MSCLSPSALLSPVAKASVCVCVCICEVAAFSPSFARINLICRLVECRKIAYFVVKNEEITYFYDKAEVEVDARYPPIIGQQYAGSWLKGHIYCKTPSARPLYMCSNRLTSNLRRWSNSIVANATTKRANKTKRAESGLDKVGKAIEKKSIAHKSPDTQKPHARHFLMDLENFRSNFFVFGCGTMQNWCTEHWNHQIESLVQWVSGSVGSCVARRTNVIFHFDWTHFGWWTSFIIHRLARQTDRLPSIP